jgi:ribosomal protein S24E
MLLSTSHNFLFVHFPKTAGAATQRMLHAYCDSPERTLWNSFKRRLPIRKTPETAHLRTHETAASMRITLRDDVYDSMHSFAVCQHPFNHVVSHFEYMKQYRSAKIAKKFEGVKCTYYLKMRARPRMPWERIFVHLPDHSYFVLDSENKIVVDRLMSFETLHQEMHDLQKDLGLRNELFSKFNVTKARTKREERLADYYGTEEIELMLKIYRSAKFHCVRLCASSNSHIALITVDGKPNHADA